MVNVVHHFANKCVDAFQRNQKEIAIGIALSAIGIALEILVHGSPFPESAPPEKTYTSIWLNIIQSIAGRVVFCLGCIILVNRIRLGKEMHPAARDRNLVNLNGENLPNGQTPLRIAAKNGDAARVRLLLQNGVDANFESDGCTALHQAAEDGRADIVQLLLDYEARVNHAGPGGFTPLHAAAKNGHTEVVRLLLDRGATKDQEAINRRTPLYEAVEHGHAEVARLLINSGADVNHMSPGDLTNLPYVYGAEPLRFYDGGSIDRVTHNEPIPLYDAADDRSADIARIGVNHGASLHFLASNSTTPLLLAVISGNAEVVDLLLDNGADVGLGPQGHTLLFAAASGGHIDVLRILQTEIGPDARLQRELIGYVRRVHGNELANELREIFEAPSASVACAG